MAQRLSKLDAERADRFPPEADGQFDVVPTATISAWREKLNEKFGIGQGKLKVLDDPARAV